jgi:hypothetical protein
MSPQCPAFRARILIDGDDFGRRQNIFDRTAHGAKIIARDRWRGHDGPHAEVRAVLIVTQAAIDVVEARWIRI